MSPPPPATPGPGASRPRSVTTTPAPDASRMLLRERVHRRARDSDRYRWWILFVVLGGLLSSNILITVFVVALPKVADGLHTSVPTVTWVVTGPMLAYAVFAPLAGKLSDRWGHRRFYLGAMAVNVAVAVLSATAPTVGVLIVARVAGGAVGAGLAASSMALVLGMFGKGERVKAMGWWALVGAGGPVLGVAVGGAIIQSIGWRWMFILEMVVGTVGLLAAMLVLPRRAEHVTPSRVVPFDSGGAVLVVVSVGGLLLGLNRAPVLGWGSPVVLGAFASAVVGAAVLVPVERRAADPLLPLRYLRQRNFAFPIGAQMFAQFSYMGGFFLAPLLLEQVYGHGESAAGLLVVPRPLSFSLSAPIAGYVAVRVGERTAAVTGTLAVVASMLVFALTGHDTGIALVECALVLSGIGLGVASPSIAASVANVVRHDELGTASATSQFMTMIAAVAGVQVMQTIVAADAHGQQGAALLPAFHAAFLVGALVAGAGVVCAAFVRSALRAPARRALTVRRGGPDPRALPHPMPSGPLPHGALELEVADEVATG